MNEVELTAAIERMLRTRGERVLLPGGDDAAVVRARAAAVTSIDTIVEDVHFQLSDHSPADVGHKALGAALSDLAAMGADPGEAFVSLALPERFGASSTLELVAAMEALAERTQTTIAGGDLTRAAVLVASVTVTGWSDDARGPRSRAGAQPGDALGVTGALGGSGAGLILLEGKGADLPPSLREPLIARHRRPEPLLRAGRLLADAGATAMIDVSDGVATDAGHLARRSQVAIQVRLGDLPLDRGVGEVAAAAGRDAAELAATAGEDYELLVTFPTDRCARAEAAAASAGTQLTWIGVAAAGTGLELLDEDGRRVELAGYSHL